MWICDFTYICLPWGAILRPSTKFMSRCIYERTPPAQNMTITANLETQSASLWTHICWVRCTYMVQQKCRTLENVIASCTFIFKPNKKLCISFKLHCLLKAYILQHENLTYSFRTRKIIKNHIQTNALYPYFVPVPKSNYVFPAAKYDLYTHT